LTGRVHLLPGTTSSSIAARGNDDPKYGATMTIADLESWIALEIAGRYHRKTHRSLGVSPLAAWEAAISKGEFPAGECVLVADHVQITIELAGG
jgi:putative transposase